MHRFYKINLILLITLVLSACEESTQEASITKQSLSEKPLENTKKIPLDSYKTIEWTDLIPEDDLNALLNPPTYITEIEDGSVEDQISSQVQNTMAAASDDRYQQALASTQVVADMDGLAIRMPGYIVPLEFDDEQAVTQFFLVPYFGACIHVPPPPPNQIIFVNYAKGLELKDLYDPYWLSGVLKTSVIENDLATAAYTMDLQHYELYSE